MVFQRETTAREFTDDLGRIGTQVLEMSGDGGFTEAGTVLAMKITTSSP
jgi:adenosyl cobinamide kinase/adenosyl cobinamide phosphate guanylyltransferase